MIIVINGSNLVSDVRVSPRNNTIQSFERIFEEYRLLNTVRADGHNQEEYPTRGDHVYPLIRAALRILIFPHDLFNHILGIFMPETIIIHVTNGGQKNCKIGAGEIRIASSIRSKCTSLINGIDPRRLEF